MEGPGIDEVTALVQELVRRISSKREIRQNAHHLANVVLQREIEKLRILEKYDSEREALETAKLNSKEDDKETKEPSSLINLNAQIDDMSNSKDEFESESTDSLPDIDSDDESESRQLLRENLELRVQLQKLQEVESKSNELICGYELAMANIRTSVDGYSESYEPSLNWVVDSYKIRLNEEEQIYDELKSSHDRLLFSLAALRSSLSKGRNILDQAIDGYQAKHHV